jgi:hypothetical protein
MDHWACAVDFRATRPLTFVIVTRRLVANGVVVKIVASVSPSFMSHGRLPSQPSGFGDWSIIDLAPGNRHPAVCCLVPCFRTPSLLHGRRSLQRPLTLPRQSPAASHLDLSAATSTLAAADECTSLHQDQLELASFRAVLESCPWMQEVVPNTWGRHELPEQAAPLPIDLHRAMVAHSNLAEVARLPDSKVAAPTTHLARREVAML